MQQSRHPNILLYLGLCLAPPPPEDSLTDNGTSRSTRILIISEYVPRGNLRQYILDRTLPFPWRLRMSFSIDVARALSYLHASPRNCMHRDLKGENLLVTENERIKICDFGLARVVDEVSGSAEMQRSRPLTYCGTDGCELDFSLFVSFRRLTDFSLTDADQTCLPKSYSANPLPSRPTSSPSVSSSSKSLLELSLLNTTSFDLLPTTDSTSQKFDPPSPLAVPKRSSTSLYAVATFTLNVDPS